MSAVAWARDLSWRIAHNIVPVNAYMFNLKISKNATCPYCKWPETLSHCFYSCTVVKPVWTFVESWITAVLGSRFVISANFVVYFQDLNVRSKSMRTFVNVIASELKLVIWFHRNRTKFEKKTPTTAKIFKDTLYTQLITG